MDYYYDNVARCFFEDLKPLFINYMRRNFSITYDDIMDIYSEVWIDVFDNIKHGKVEKGTKWKAYILKMGWNKANHLARRKDRFRDSFDDERFDMDKFEKEHQKRTSGENSICSDPDVNAVLATELGYIPDPCNKILKMFYFEGLSMADISDTMNYSSSRSAITMKNRCLGKLKKRIFDSVRLLGLLD